MEIDELSEHLDALERDDCYRVDSVLKEGSYEVTQKVFFVGTNGAEQGPYIRKYIDNDSGLGKAYERIFAAQKAGKRFRFIPKVYDCYVAGEQLVVVMEYVPGETLQDVVYRCDPSNELAIDIFPRLCDAVMELHDQFTPPLIHRDLKPSNVMIAKESLTIIDFGIARSYDHEVDKDTHHFGTRSYAPPEQFGYGQTDVRSDVYALGAILYFCLAEKNFTPGTFEATPHIHESFAAVIRKATQFSPQDRYGDVQELKLAFGESIARYRVSSGFEVSTSMQGVAHLPRPIGSPVIPSEHMVESGSNGIIPQVHTSAYRVPGAHQHDSEKKGTLSHIPYSLGVAWDAVLVLLAVLFVYVAFNNSFDPTAGSSMASLPLPIRLTQNLSLALGFFVPLFYLVSDKRPLVKHLSRYTKISILRDVVVCIVMFAVSILIIYLSSFFY